MRALSPTVVVSVAWWLLCSYSPAASAENPEDRGPGKAAAAIDSVFTILEDLTADGEPDSLVLRIRGESMDDPFTWTVRIWVRGDLVFERETDDAWMDGLFGEPGYAGDSGNREQDKASYYYDYLPNNLFVRDRFWPGHTIFDGSSGASVYQTLARELRQRGLVDEETVQGIIERMVARLQAGTVLLSIPSSPVLSEFPRIYIEEVGEFVPVFVW